LKACIMCGPLLAYSYTADRERQIRDDGLEQARERQSAHPRQLDFLGGVLLERGVEFLLRKLEPLTSPRDCIVQPLIAISTRGRAIYHI
jgi:hypothetical protein